MFHMNQVFNTSHTRRHVGVPLKYSLEKLWNISNRQSYIIDTWKVPYAWINPSITRHPNNSNVAIMIYRIPDPKKKDKIGHLQFEMGFKVIVKKPDMLGKKKYVSSMWCLTHSMFCDQNSWAQIHPER